MRKTPFIFCFLLLCISCQSNSDQHEEIVEIKDSGDEIPYNVLIGSDSFDFDTNSDTNIFIYPHLTIASIPKADKPGEIIRMIKDGKEHTFDIEAAYFNGKIGDYLLFDIGTSSVRTLEIYDSKNLSQVLKVVDYRDLTAQNPSITFKTRIQALRASQTPPPCPEELKEMKENVGYFQTKVFDFSTLTLKDSDLVTCEYVE